ncbi:UPF0182 family protein [Clostridium fungisolvens]|uniref:UPF0182 protein bsdtw1_04495 n=1 Tax=Clostridium fungisolvens TaxID=1604897 RepID=A0A6V8STP6_9CLOT|nr:UPF0182 family protein [Clostridium fungisolvens]GFP78283.1 hypothetical protein bsdtw1_04495 [Clostridium fungisolvens]
MKKIYWLLASVVIIVMLILSFSNLIVNIQWFREVGYLTVYFTKLIAILKLMVPIFAVCFIVVHFYLKSLTKSLLTQLEGKKKRYIKVVSIVGNLILSLIISYYTASTYWYTILQFTNSVNFNDKDPIFGHDISFYIFKLPLIQSLYNVLLSLIITIIAITVVYYLVVKLKRNVTDKGNWRTNGSEVFKNFAGKQFAIVSAILMFMISGGYVLKSYNLLYSARGTVFGAGYADIRITLLFYRAIAIVSLVSAIIVFVSILRAKIKPIITVAALIFVMIICEPIVASVFQQFIVKSNEMDFEKQYISNNINATRKAFNIDKIKENEFEPKQNLSDKVLQNNTDIIENLKVNSISPVLNFYNQVQVMKNYYKFNDGDTDRYNINGKYTQVFVAPRELDYSNINTWQNMHLRYTHGYGITMSKVNSVTSEGQPDFVMKDIPTENLTDIKLDNPRIYFGEGSNEYVVVNTDIDEFDYPKAGETQTNRYEGKAGIKMNFLNKVLFSVNQGNVRILMSGDIKGDSKIILNRNIMDRVKKIAPFLSYDSDAYSVIKDGRIFWVVDAYTTSNKYPYSQPYNGFNYIRNSVKVVIDAYNGDTNFYIVDKNDPIAASYSKIFKGLFKDGDTLPKEIREHLRYPNDIFNIQCDVLGKYHVTDPTVFFTQDDLWEVSSNILSVEGKEDVNESLYLMTRLPGEKNLEMVMFEYFNMKGKQNMVSLLGARMDGENYGKLVMYKFPPQKTILSPSLLKNKILADPDISKEISLWEGKGSKVEYGDTVIIPINDSLFYLETLYLKADVQKSLPEVRKIILSDGEKIVGDETVEKALQKLFNYTNQSNRPVENNTNNNKGNVENGNSGNVSNDDISKANELYQKALDAQKAGDWSAYGEYIKQLGDILKNMKK